MVNPLLAIVAAVVAVGVAVWAAASYMKWDLPPLKAGATGETGFRFSPITFPEQWWAIGGLTLPISMYGSGSGRLSWGSPTALQLEINR